MSPIGRKSPTVCVFAPNLYLSVTIEAGTRDGYDDVHIHPGGQGFWIARLLSRLDEHPVMVAAVGGEIGRVLSGLVPEWGVDLVPVATDGNSGGYVFDRRSGQRSEIGRSPAPQLGRHELDELYGTTLECAAQTSMCVVTGRAADGDIPVDMYRRLAADLHATQVPVVADLHGEELASFLDGGPLHILKVSDEDMAADGHLGQDPTTGQRIEVARRLQEQGAANVVVSASTGPTVAVFGDRMLTAEAPRLEAVDHRGSGDSMTAGLVSAYSRGYDPAASLRLACAAGAANVTRHGLATASSELIETLAGQVEVETVERSGLSGG